VQELKGQVKNLQKKQAVAEAKQSPKPGNSKSQVAVSDAKYLPPVSEDKSVPVRQEARAVERLERNQGGSKRNLFIVALIGVASVVGGLIGRFTASSPPPILQGRRGIIVTGSVSDLTGSDVLADSLRVHLDLMSKEGNQTIPNLATIIGETLTHEQSNQLIKMLENQQAENIKQEDNVTAEQPDSELETEDTEALEQQFALAKDYFRRGGYEFMLQGRVLLQKLVARGYLPAQYFLGSMLDFMGRPINRSDLVDQGRALLQQAVKQGDVMAEQHLKRSLSGAAIPEVGGICVNVKRLIASEEWTNNNRFKKRFQTAMQERYQIISEEMAPLEKEQTIKKRNEAFESIKQLAEEENYALAQYWYGAHLLLASKAVDDENLKEQGSILLAKAAKQGVKEAVDLLMVYAFIKTQDMPLLEAMNVPSASRTATDSDKPGANVSDRQENNVAAAPLKTPAEIYHLGLIAWDDQQYDEAIKYFLQAAESGNQSAEYHLGLCYLRGQGVKPDILLAAQYFELAANKGVFAAQYELGILYYKGEGVGKNLPKAMMLFKKAHAQVDGILSKQVHEHIGLLKQEAIIAYKSGIQLLADNTERSNQLAAEQFRLAASLDHEDAQRVLEECFSFTAKGIGRIGTCQFSPTVPEQASAQAGEAKNLPAASALNNVGLFSESAAAQNVAPSPQKLSNKEIADLRRDIKENCRFMTSQECYEKMVKLADQIKIGATRVNPEDFSVQTSVRNEAPSLYKNHQTKEWYAKTLKYYAGTLRSKADKNPGYSHHNR
jgi:TPR repeat protein